MKKKLLYIATLLISVSIIGGGTIAYFTTEDTARNVITAGGLGVEVIEQQEIDGVLQPYPSEPIKMMPGTSVSKIVSVQSLDQAVWVRMTYDITVLNEAKEELQVSEEELDRMIEVSYDTEKWIEKEDWWYYPTTLKGGEITEPLFESISFSGIEIGNEYQGATIEFIVTAQAVQQANNGSAVMEAAGWPEKK